MRDQAFLAWFYCRLRFVHGEDPNVDYMHKLIALIRATPPEKVTPVTASDQASIQALAEELLHVKAWAMDLPKEEPK